MSPADGKRNRLAFEAELLGVGGGVPRGAVKFPPGGKEGGVMAVWAVSNATLHKAMMLRK